ncbi:MAG: hypothetical protein ACI957_005490, partial [Verrucomicrobiales bacterium]
MVSSDQAREKVTVGHLRFGSPSIHFAHPTAYVEYGILYYV